MIAKQMDVRSNIKKFFDIAYSGEPVVVPRKQDHNVVIISESEYNRLSQASRAAAYADSLIRSRDTRKAAKEQSGSLKALNAEKLKRIRSMKDNWNGNGASAFPKALINRVENLINGLDIQPELFPTAMCTIQLEYDNSRRDHMEIEIGENDQAEVFIVNFNGKETLETIYISPETINERVTSFYG